MPERRSPTRAADRAVSRERIHHHRPRIRANGQPRVVPLVVPRWLRGQIYAVGIAFGAGGRGTAAPAPERVREEDSSHCRVLVGQQRMNEGFHRPVIRAADISTAALSPPEAFNMRCLVPRLHDTKVSILGAPMTRHVGPDDVPPSARARSGSGRKTSLPVPRSRLPTAGRGARG